MISKISKQTFFDNKAVYFTTNWSQKVVFFLFATENTYQVLGYIYIVTNYYLSSVPVTLSSSWSTSTCYNQVFHDRPVWSISQIIWQIWSYTVQNKFHQKLPLWGLNPQPPDHHSPVLWTEWGRNLLEISEVSFLLFHAPLHMLDFVLFLESIEHNFIKALMIHIHNQIVT